MMLPEKESTEIGELIDTLLDQERSKRHKNLTAYIEETVSPDSRLSARQIGRIRTISSDFPEGEAIEKLAIPIPQVSILNPNNIVNRLLWGWKNIEYDQKNLIAEKNCGDHSLTIFSGWQPPIGLTNEDVVKSIARNIRQDFTYEFVYPDSSTYPENLDQKLVTSKIIQWIEELKNNVSIAWLHDSRSNIDRSKLSKNLDEFLVELDLKLKYRQTGLRTDIWLRLPSNYCVMYNLGLTKKDSKFRYGSFRVEGQLVRSTTPVDSIISSGWLHTTDNQYKLIEDSYEKVLREKITNK
jgi:hypothetical protein